MAATLVVKRTFLEYEASSASSGPRERAFSEGALPSEQWPLKSSLSKDDASTASTTEEAQSSLESVDGDLNFEDSDVSLDEVTQSNNSAMPPGQWSTPAQNCTMAPLTWFVMPVSSPMLAQDARVQSNVSRAPVKKRKSKSQRGKGLEMEIGRTTVIIRGLSQEISLAGFLEMLDTHGFKGLYDFVYLPRNFKTARSLGYAIVNLVASEHAHEAIRQFSEYSASFSDSHKGGLMMLIQRYRDSPMMHPEVPNEYKPAVFVSGCRVAFPPPSTPVSTPEFERIIKLVREHQHES